MKCLQVVRTIRSETRINIFLNILFKKTKFFSVIHIEINTIEQHHIKSNKEADIMNFAFVRRVRSLHGVK